MTAQGDLTVTDTMTCASNSIYIMLSDNPKGASEKVFLLFYHRDAIESKSPHILNLYRGKIYNGDYRVLYHYRDIIESKGPHILNIYRGKYRIMGI